MVLSGIVVSEMKVRPGVHGGTGVGDGMGVSDGTTVAGTEGIDVMVSRRVGEATGGLAGIVVTVCAQALKITVNPKKQMDTQARKNRLVSIWSSAF